MFDPYFIGEVERKDVRVVQPLEDGRFQLLKAVVKLGEGYHALILKPNIARERDQIVLDRLKHVFNLTPMHTFGLKLDFVYSNGTQYDSDWTEYFAFASSLHEGVLEAVEDIDDLSEEHKIQAVMILLFRYLVGAIRNRNEHILIRNQKLVSISEGRFTTMEMCSDFASQFVNIPVQIWIEARSRFLKGVLLDNIRGVVLQVDHPTNNIDGKASKGPLSIPVRRIMVSIENRLDLVKTSDVKELRERLNVV
jgi:hypothetical protein